MPRLFGRSYSRQELLQRIGNLSQIGGVEPFELVEGNTRGVRALRFRTGSGFSFTVLPDRGMDISAAEFNGQSLCWHSPTGPVAPAFYEPEGAGWLWGFFGGLLTTCGLTNTGPAGEDGGERYGLHGRASYLPAAEVAWSATWDGDECLLECRGTIREARLFGHNLTLTRRISAWLGESSLHIEDSVRNDGWTTSPLMILYHINAGFPLLDEGSRLIAPSRVVTPRDAEAESGLSVYDTFSAPLPDYKEQVFIHELAAADDGRTGAAVVSETQGEHGLGLYVRFRQDQLPALFEWRQVGQGAYVVGVEPSNSANILGRAQARQEGSLPTLEPGEERRFQLEIGVLDGAAAISGFEREMTMLSEFSDLTTNHIDDQPAD